MLQILFDFFSGKAKTRIYTTFLGWLLTFHADIIFVAIFTDQTILFEKNNQLKGEYLWSYFTATKEWYFIIGLELLRIGASILVTYLLIWVVPKLLNERSYKEELAVEFALRKMKIKEEDTLNKREKTVVKQQMENIKAEKKVVAERAKLETDPEQASFDSEFDEFIKNKNAKETIDEISNTVYAEGGNLIKYTDYQGYSRRATGVQANNLALADTYGLVTIVENGKSLTLTPKGKLFIRRMSGQ